MFGFKKKRVIDFTPLRQEVKKQPDVRDFTQSQEDNSSGLGFLGAIAQAEPEMKAIEDIHIKDLKVKLEDVEYKLDNFSKRISGLMDRVDLLEKKVDRDLRRGSL